jgi:CheY-like chemotaxis protein
MIMLHILLVEDDLQAQAHMAAKLTELGHTVATATTIMELDDRITEYESKNEHIDIFLIDYWLIYSGINIPGTETYYTIRHFECSKTPIIAASSDMSMWENFARTLNDPNLHLIGKISGKWDAQATIAKIDSLFQKEPS